MNGIVTLEGKETTSEEIRIAAEIAQATEGVTSIRNATAFGLNKDSAISEKSPEITVDAKEIISDGWITAKIKYLINTSYKSQKDRIKVDTKNGIVRLHGTIDNTSERDLAIHAIERIDGVKDVKSDLILRH